MTIAQRSVTSVGWNVTTNGIKVAVLLARSILLARVLPVETFGVYTLATSIVTFSGILPLFGTSTAFLHRTTETADEEPAAAVHFTLRLALVMLWAAALIGLAVLLTQGELRYALIFLTVAFVGLHLTDTPRYILVRRVEHRRLAVLDLLTAMVTTGVAVALAYRGFGLTALLATDAATFLLAVGGLYLWRPVWRPRLLWLRETVRYYLSFGSRSMSESALSEALDNFDDIWTGYYLGNGPLGLCSRAYTFATYPRRFLAMPVNVVAGGTYAELKSDRLRLSKAFFRTNALLVRSGFLLGGLLALVAPEFTRLALGDKWLPMVPAFRLMILFTLLDPMRLTLSGLFTAVGRPERMVRIRALQLAVLIAGLYTLGRLWGIEGVALVVNGVLLLGLIPLLWMARAYVDFSNRRLFGAPGLALCLGGIAGWAAQQAACGLSACPSDWLTGLAKGVAYVGVFCFVLFLLEREDMAAMVAQGRAAMRPRRSAIEPDGRS
jgi:O-antigen/teichoic acid export membrane protein